jgi:hypothetical protein
MDVARERTIELWRASERARTRARLRVVIVPGLEELVDPAADPADLIVLADVQARRLRSELESLGDSDDVISLDPLAALAREDERDWVRGHLHDTALQILEFIAGDGFGTGLSAPRTTCAAGSTAATRRTAGRNCCPSSSRSPPRRARWTRASSSWWVTSARRRPASRSPRSPAPSARRSPTRASTRTPRP